jgi:hypothetical protein
MKLSAEFTRSSTRRADGAIWEDFWDGLVSESRRAEKSIPYEKYPARRKTHPPAWISTQGMRAARECAINCQTKMVRIAAAIVFGYLAVGVLVVLTDLIVAGRQPQYYFVIVTFTDTLYSMAGGYLCAAIARNDVRKATVGLMIFGEVFGVAAAVLNWNSQPHWLGLGLLVLFPLAVWWGSKLRTQLAD